MGEVTFHAGQSAGFKAGGGFVLFATGIADDEVKRCGVVEDHTIATVGQRELRLPRVRLIHLPGDGYRAVEKLNTRLQRQLERIRLIAFSAEFPAR